MTATHSLVAIKIMGIECETNLPYILITDHCNPRWLMVVLSRDQINMAQELEVGEFCLIHALRLQETAPHTGRYRGRLGGDRKLLFKLNLEGEQTADLRRLLALVISH